MRITAFVQHKSHGHWEYIYLALPPKGTRTVHIDVQVSDVDSHSTEQTLRVR